MSEPWKRPPGVPVTLVPDLLSPATKHALARKGRPRTAAGRVKAAAKAQTSPDLFLALLRARGLPQPHQEYRFHDSRLWRFDYAFPAWNLAIEVDGGLFVRGAHVRGARILKTHEKLNAAAAMGWRILYTTPDRLCSGEFIDTIKASLDWHLP